MLVANGLNLPSSGEEGHGFQVTSQDGVPESPSCYLLGYNGSVVNNCPVGYTGTTGYTAQCEQYSSTDSNESKRAAVGQGHVRAGWTVESQSQLPSGVRRSDSWEEAHYTSISTPVTGSGKNNTNNKTKIFDGIQRPMVKHLPLHPCVSAPAPNSPASVGGQYSMSTDFGNNANTPSFISDASNNHASITQHLSGLNVNVISSLRPSNTLDAAWSPPYGTPTVMANSSHLGFGEVERSKILPLRFKMLPSPVPYEKFWNNLANPTERDLAPYYRVMMRWYEHIVVTQESTRTRVRLACPPPPDSLKMLREEDLWEMSRWGSNELQNWAAQCCNWWEEISRKRGRRVHRNGKAQSNGSAGKVIGVPQRHVEAVGTCQTISYTEPPNRKNEEMGIDVFVHRFCNDVLGDE